MWSITHFFFLFSLGLSLLKFLFVCFTCIPITCAPFTLSGGVTCLCRLIILNTRNDLRLQRQCIMNYLFSERKSKAFDIPILYLVVPWLWETKKKRIFKVMMYNEMTTSRCFKSFFSLCSRMRRWLEFCNPQCLHCSMISSWMNTFFSTKIGITPGAQRISSLHSQL